MKVTNTTQPSNQTFTIELTTEEIHSLAHVHALIGVNVQEVRQERDRINHVLATQPIHNPLHTAYRNKLVDTIKHIRTAGALLERLIPSQIVTAEDWGNIHRELEKGYDL